MSAYDFESLNYHTGHDVVVVRYGDNEMTLNVAVECNDCREVILDYDAPDLEEEKPVKDTGDGPKGLKDILSWDKEKSRR